MSVLSIEVPIRKKSGNLFNDPRIYIYIYIYIYVTLCRWSAKQTIPLSVLARNQTKGFRPAIST